MVVAEVHVPCAEVAASDSSQDHLDEVAFAYAEQVAVPHYGHIHNFCRDYLFGLYLHNNEVSGRTINSR